MGQNKQIPSGGREEGARMQIMGSGDVSVRPDSYHVALLQNSLVQKEKFLFSFTIPTSSNIPRCSPVFRTLCCVFGRQHRNAYGMVLGARC